MVDTNSFNTSFLSKTLFSEPLHQIIQKINWWYQYKMFDIIKHFFALNKSWHYDNNNSHHPKSYEQLSHLYLNIAIPTTYNKHMRSCHTYLVIPTLKDSSIQEHNNI